VKKEEAERRANQEIIRRIYTSKFQEENWTRENEELERERKRLEREIFPE
jgi:hypothetical protein